ncbi:hypothetical protein BLNAU_4066 [Blattamonas nauphoetae]|uniref:Uncharacterized protein n=1 Tax=Blattamonas nauphoetae TaxID=2049346 RepID=A0ABQ9YBJ2_9EUKA|nr:hypothetical protein BLNAU_4066 [Blattamonas nauphoetae]
MSRPTHELDHQPFIHLWDVIHNFFGNSLHIQMDKTVHDSTAVIVFQGKILGIISLKLQTNCDITHLFAHREDLVMIDSMALNFVRSSYYYLQTTPELFDAKYVTIPICFPTAPTPHYSFLKILKTGQGYSCSIYMLLFATRNLSDLQDQSQYVTGTEVFKPLELRRDITHFYDKYPRLLSFSSSTSSLPSSSSTVASSHNTPIQRHPPITMTSPPGFHQTPPPPTLLSTIRLQDLNGQPSTSYLQPPHPVPVSIPSPNPHPQPPSSHPNTPPSVPKQTISHPIVLPPPPPKPNPSQFNVSAPPAVYSQPPIQTVNPASIVSHDLPRPAHEEVAIRYFVDMCQRQSQSLKIPDAEISNHPLPEFGASKLALRAIADGMESNPNLLNEAHIIQNVSKNDWPSSCSMNVFVKTETLCQSLQEIFNFRL